MPTQQLLIGAFVIINIIAFFIVSMDKRKAVVGNNAERTPEGKLFFYAAAFGAVGVYAGMQIFRHKTKKWYFQLGIPLLILQNLATLYVIYQLPHVWPV